MCLKLNIDGQAAIICGLRQRKLGLCRFCRRQEATRLCDYKLKPGKTCDAAMCQACATRIGEDKDLCPDHAHTRPQLGLPGMDWEAQIDPAAPDAHARHVLYRGAGPWPLSQVQRELLRLLLFHQGAARAIPLRDIIMKLGGILKQIPTERDIKEAARGLVVDFKVKIGAARIGNIGYYLITNADEARSTARPYIEEIKKLAQRVRVLLDPHDLAELEGQKLLGGDGQEAV